ncbi:hypothetical protein CI102_14529 [Trichoderma harzianum]|nr:hypothetical protein CI102_14529 [Trichoderma harzianum]
MSAGEHTTLSLDVISSRANDVISGLVAIEDAIQYLLDAKKDIYNTNIEDHYSNKVDDQRRQLQDDDECFSGIFDFNSSLSYNDVTFQRAMEMFEDQLWVHKRLFEHLTIDNLEIDLLVDQIRESESYLMELRSDIAALKSLVRACDDGYALVHSEKTGEMEYLFVFDLVKRVSYIQKMGLMSMWTLCY